MNKPSISLRDALPPRGPTMEPPFASNSTSKPAATKTDTDKIGRRTSATSKRTTIGLLAVSKVTLLEP
jgi:hypothetical protein